MGMDELEIKFGELSQERLGEFIERGYKQRFFFPHNILYLPKWGPHGLKLASRCVTYVSPINCGKYGSYQLPHNREFLEKIRAMGTFKTLNEIANEMFLSCAR